MRHGRFEPPWAWWGAFSDSLVVVRLEFRSPGFGDVSGIGGPLEALRKTRVDRDERRKDKEWREELDREQQEAEIALKRREEEKLRVETGNLALEADRKRIEAFRDKYELLAGVFGVDYARKWAAQELAGGAEAIDALEGDADEVPAMLEQPDAPDAMQ